MELCGSWQAAAADEALRREFHAPGFDDGHWASVPVPGHWGDQPDLADARSVLHRRRFDLASEHIDGGVDRWWLEVDGVFDQGDVWLDGNYLGDTEGYFIPHAFDVTGLLRSGERHELAIEVTCAPTGAHGKRRAILGVFEGGNAMVRDTNPGGIWAPVRLRRTGPVRIERLRAICTDADERRARVAARALLISDAPRSITLRTRIGGVEHEQTQSLAEGENQVEWHVTIDDPALWWPRALGDQPLYDLRVVAETDGGVESDECVRRLGLRRVSMKGWRLSVNGERLFCKGANVAPPRPLLAHASDADVDAQIDLALEAGLDLVRPWAHVALDRFYDRADAVGLLVWQDLPLQGHASNGLRRQAVRHATAMVDRLGHHPSIVTWNAHVSPADEWMQSGPATTRERLGRLAGHQLPTWTKSVLDRSIKSVFDHADGSRHSSGFTGVLPHLPRLDGTATNLWFGWRRGSERQLPEFAARWPSQVRFVTEFGAQSVPDADVVDLTRWPDVDRTELEAAGYETASFARYVPPDPHVDAAEWRRASQQYQAGLVRRQIESLRRLKYRPTGGFCVTSLADTSPVIGFGLVDHEGHRKPGYEALVEACRPVIVVADRLPPSLQPGEAYALDIHVVNDTRHALESALVEAELTWTGGGHRWRFTGSCGADDVARVGTLSWVVPDARGLATLSITLFRESGGPVEAWNHYHATIR